MQFEQLISRRTAVPPNVSLGGCALERWSVIHLPAYAIAEEKMSIEAAAKLETFHNFDREILNCKVTSKWPRNLTQNVGQPIFGH